MAKGNLLLGTARKSIGDITMYRRNGQQVARVRVRKIANPKSEPQMVQRIVMNTVAQAYSRLKMVCNHSFEGITPGSANMARFMRLNLSTLRGRLVRSGEDMNLEECFIPVGSKFLVPNEYILAQGSLPSVKPFITTTQPEGADYPTFVAGLPQVANTYQGIITKFGLQRGDQLTFVVIAGSTASIVDSIQDEHQVYPNFSDCNVLYTRVILDPTNADGTPAELSTPFLNDGDINLPSPNNDGNTRFTWEYDNASYNITLALPEWDVFAIGVIVSRRGSDGEWDRSNAQMVATDYTFYANVGNALQAGSDAQVGTSSRYLNQATD